MLTLYICSIANSCLSFDFLSESYDRMYYEVYGNFKVQLISKCFFGVFSSPKKLTKKFDLTTMVPQVKLFSFIFWENWRHKKDISKFTDLYHIYFNWYIFFEIKSLLHHLHLFAST